MDGLISGAEVTEVVKQLRGGGAPGIDEIHPGYLKALDVVGLSWLSWLLSIYWSIYVPILTYDVSVPDVADSEVSCVFMESCVLPCSFQGGADVIIHWNQVTTGNLVVHSYYNKQDKFTHQNQRFKGRTSLFKDQISEGNTSLQLTGVQVQDQGRYTCYFTVPSTSTPTLQKELYVKQIRFACFAAPVRKVDLQQVGDRITCSSEGIYPEPELTWSTSPPSNVTFKNETEVQKTEQLLYNISSSLIPSDTDLNYSCSVSTRRNKKRATLFKTSEYFYSSTVLK
uniref:Ig-like domain-containing protein n=1 Tax=Seriola dumerili TaxID=41447 RepID=A0A3B4U0H0_SERDU